MNLPTPWHTTKCLWYYWLDLYTGLYASMHTVSDRLERVINYCIEMSDRALE